MSKGLPSIKKLPDELLLRVFKLTKTDSFFIWKHIPRVCKRWNLLSASPSLWKSLLVRVPLVRRHSPSWEWVQTWERVQTRLLDAEHLRLAILSRTAQEHDLAAARLEGELLTAHLLFVLSHAKACKLRELSILHVYPGERLCHTLIGHEYRAISRFTLLTALTFGSLVVEAGTLQGLTGLSSLREFECYALKCPQIAAADLQNFSGAVAQALWTMALGWPQLTALRFTHCALSSGEVSGDIETSPGTHPLRLLKVIGCGSASALVSGISALQNLEHLEIAVGDSLGTIGKLRALTRLRTKFYGTGPHYELHLENPKLHCLSVLVFKKIDIPDERMWRCLSSLTSLRELHTENLKLADVPGEVSLLTRLTSLHHRDGLERLSTDLSPLQNLVELDISGSSLGGFLALPCQSLETLKMNRCHLGTLLNQEGLSKLKALPRLKKVTLHDTGRILQFGQVIVRMARELPLVDFEFCETFEH